VGHQHPQLAELELRSKLQALLVAPQGARLDFSTYVALLLKYLALVHQERRNAHFPFFSFLIVMST
jgi:hypothetical protein